MSNGLDSFAQDYDTVEEDIEEMNTLMEELFEKGELKKLADIYLDNAYLLSPRQTVYGREKIDEYWTAIKEPVKWDLNVIEVAQNEEDIYRNEYYEALKNKPPAWRSRNVEIDDDEPLVYQLGHSTLITRGENGELQESNVDFVLIWKVMPDGNYRILLDTYTWQ